MATHDDLNDGAFTDALERFDPSAEPFANMSRARIMEVMDARFAENDLDGGWEAELHLAEKTPPFDRYIHDLGLYVHAWLMVMEEKGMFPHGWTHRNILAVMIKAHEWVRERWTPETFPPLTPDESRQHADDEGIVMANRIRENRGAIEGFQTKLG